MSKIKEIIEGWTNKIFTNEQVEILSNERMEICNQCPHKIKMLSVDVCELCMCPLSAKTRSPESDCAIHKWNKQNNK